MSLADKVAAIFEGPRAARIHFRLGRLEVSPQRLRGVGKAIKKGDIKVEVASSGKLLSAVLPSAQRHADRPRRQARLGGQPGRRAARGRPCAGRHVQVQGGHRPQRRGGGLPRRGDLSARGAQLGERRARRDGDLQCGRSARQGARPVQQARRPAVGRRRADLRAAINKHPAYSSIGAKQKTSGHGLHAH